MSKILFELYDYEKYIGTYTADEISKIIGIHPKSIYDYADNGKIYKKRYVFLRESDENTYGWIQSWKLEWDSVRKKILKAMGII